MRSCLLFADKENAMIAMPAVKSILVSCLLVVSASAEDARQQVDKDGTITTVSERLQFSAWASPEALKRFQEILIEDKSSPGLGDPLASRKFYDKINADRAERMKKLYPVRIEAAKIAGVP